MAKTNGTGWNPHPQYRRRMYRLLDSYEEDYDLTRPVVGIDEKSKQLLAHMRPPMAMAPGRPARYDYENKRAIFL